MINLIIRLLINIVAILLVAYYVPGVSVEGFYTALIVSIILGFLNLTIKPILVILTLPIKIITLGLFIFVINAGLFWFVATFIEGFYVTGFLPALFATVIISIVSGVGNKILL